MVSEKNVDGTKIDLTKKGIIQPLARELNERLSNDIENPYSMNTLRSPAMIPSWIREYLEPK